MGNSQVEKYLDEGLEGKFFEDLPAPDYLNKDFSDKELDGLSKQELINIITKAVVLVCISERELRDEKTKNESKMDEHNVFIKKILSNYAIAPGLISVCSDEYKVEWATKNKRLENEKLIKDMVMLIRKIPQIKAKARSVIPSLGGKSRAAKDDRTKALKSIEEVDYPKIRHLMNLRGRRTKFAYDMLVKYEKIQNVASILKLIDKLNKTNNINQKNKY